MQWHSNQESRENDSYSPVEREREDVVAGTAIYNYMGWEAEAKTTEVATEKWGEWELSPHDNVWVLEQVAPEATLKWATTFPSRKPV